MLPSARCDCAQVGRRGSAGSRAAIGDADARHAAASAIILIPRFTHAPCPAKSGRFAPLPAACKARRLLFGRFERSLAPLDDAPLELGAEVADQALDRPGRGVAEGADGVALDLLGDVPERVDLADLGIALDEALHHPPHPAGALAARRALAAALVLVKIGDPADRLHHVGGLVHDDHRGGAEAGTEFLETVEIHWGVHDLR